MKALFAATAALVLATSASAGTVTVSNTSHKDPTGSGTAFSDAGVYSFTLDTDTWFSGLLTTKGVLSSIPAVDIRSVTLANLTTGQVINWAELIAVSWNTVRVGVEQWSLPSQQLAAGTWALNVSGVSYSNKQGNGYTADLTLPEPASAALALVAVVGALLASRRRKSV